MMGSFITRGIIMVLGYVYPAYECFKIVERRKPDLEHLRFWCEYWYATSLLFSPIWKVYQESIVSGEMIIAVVTVLERVGDALISWVPMYSEAKLAFIIYLWYPKTKGTTYVYSTFLRPFVAKHEPEIDRNLNELRTRAGDVAFFWWQRISVYVQARFFELLQYVAAQSNRPQSGPVPQQGPIRVPSQGGSQMFQPPPPPPGFTGPVAGAGYPAAPPPYPGPGAYAGPSPHPGAGLYPPVSGVSRLSSRSAMLEEEEEPDYDVVDNNADRPVPPEQDQDLPPPAYNTRNRQRTTRGW